MLNKKAQIATGLLVPLTLAIYLALFIGFVSFGNDLENNSWHLAYLINEIKFKESFVNFALGEMVKEAIENAEGGAGFEKEFRENLGSIAEKRRGPEFGNLFIKLILREYDLNRSGDIYLLRVSDVFVSVKSEVDESKITRTFDLKIWFDKNGLVQGN
jgi:hypothetical protein